MPKIGEMELDELRQWIEAIVEQKLLEMLGDPDEGLTLRPGSLNGFGALWRKLPKVKHSCPLKKSQRS
jgi:hypothetical protein